jgi:RNA polymerase sigma-70 factor (ECF subfamily)
MQKAPVSYTEFELLERSAAGDQQAFTAIFHAYKNRLYAFLLKLTESEEMTEDVIQDIFLKLWKGREGLPEIQNLSSYMFRMAQNQCINHFKRTAKQALMLAELKKSLPEGVHSTEHELDAQAVQAKLQEALARLSPQQKLVYTLSREQGLRYEQIAERMQIAPSTVKGHMISALRILREVFSSYPGSKKLLILFLSILSAFTK